MDSIIRIQRLQWNGAGHTENPFFQFDVAETVLTVTNPAENDISVKAYATEHDAKKAAEHIHNMSMVAWLKQEEYKLEMP